MPAAFVQAAKNTSVAAVASITATGAAVTAGNFIVGAATWPSQTIASPNIKDNLGNSATSVFENVSDGGGPTTTLMFYFQSAASGMTGVVFTPPSAVAGGTGVEWQEASGIASSSPLDGHSLATNASSSLNQDTPTINPAFNGDYIYACSFGTISGTSPLQSASGSGATFTLRNNDSTNFQGGDSNAIQATAGAVSGRFVIQTNPQQYLNGIVALKAAAGGGATPTWGFSSRREDERPAVVRLAEYVAPFFRPSQIPVPTQWLPTTGQEDRPPPPRMRPDDSSIESPLFFRPSPNPVPTIWLPTAGETEHPVPPPRTDWAPPWFVRSPSPVPTTWLPTTGAEDRPPAQKRPPDEPTGWFFKPVAASTTPLRWLPTTGEFDHPVPPPRTDWAPPWFVRSPSPVPVTWPPTAGEADHPPVTKHPPDVPTGWFLKAAFVSTTPNGWLPTTGEAEHPVPPPRTDWATPWYYPSQIVVPQRWLPTTGQEDRPPIFKPDLPSPSFLAPPAPPVGIAGMAWWRQTEVYFNIPPPQQDYRPAWAPQYIFQVPPVISAPATYYLLEDLWVNNQYLPAGTVQTTADLGGVLPLNWVPNPNVDPIDAGAIAAYAAAGYRPRGLMRTQFTPLPVRAPNYNWRLVNNEWTLVKTGNF